MCFRYEAKMNASLPSILIDNHYKSLRYDQNAFHFVLRQVSAYIQKYEEYGLAVLGITRSQSIFDFLEKNKFTIHSIVPQILL